MLLAFETFLVAGRDSANQVYRADQDAALLFLLNTLAAYYIEAYRQSESLVYDGKEAKSGNELLNDATQLINQAEEIDRQDVLTISLKGSLNLLRGNADDALYALQAAVRMGGTNLFALAGLADAQFRKGNYKEALVSYQRVLAEMPDASPDVRLPIGICFAKLGMPTEAKLAFKRVCERDPKNATALMLSSIVDLNESRASKSAQEKEALRKKSMENLMRSFKLDPRHGLVGIHMAERLIQRKDFDKALVLIETALKTSDAPSLKAEALSIKGRILQAQEKYQQSFEVFQAAVNLNAKSVLAQFGVGQMYIFTGQPKLACKALEKVIAVEPNSYETRRILASLYAVHPDAASKAATHFEALKALLKTYHEEDTGARNSTEEQYIKDPEVMAELAMLAERESVQSALKAYTQVLDLMQKNADSVIPPELLNNIAVLSHLDAEAQAPFNPDGHTPASLLSAEKLYENALIILTQESFIEKQDPARVNAIQTTIRFNVARLYEAKGESEKAKQQYNDLLKVHPAYIECILRLGLIALNEGDHEKAIEHFTEALNIDEKNASAMNLLSYAYACAKKYKEARKSAEKVLRDVNKHDSYALVTIGNMCLRFAADDKAQRDVHLKRAVEFLCIALRHDPRNVRAASGIAIAYAISKHFENALEVYTQIQGLLHNDKDILLNMAQVLISLDRLDVAINTYEAILKKYKKPDANVLQAIAKAHYMNARKKSNPESILKAKDYALRALELDPDNSAYKFNVGLVKQQYAQILNQQPSEKRHLRPIHALQDALAGLHEAEALFLELSECQKPLGFTPKQAKDRAVYCASVRKITDKKIHEAETLAKMRKQQLEEMDARREELERKAIEEQVGGLTQERQERERQEREAEIERKRKELQEKVREENEKMRLRAEYDRKRQMQKVGDSSEEEEEQDRRQKRRKRKVEEEKKVDEEKQDNQDKQESEDEPEVKIPRGIKSNLSSAIVEDDSE